MFRTDAQGHQGNRFVGGNPFAGVNGTKVTADWLNAVQEDLCLLIEEEGIVLDKLDDEQLTEAVHKAIRRLAGGRLAFTAGANLTAGDGLLVEDAFGVVEETVLSGNPAAILVLGTYTLPKVAADSWGPGKRLYWDAGASKLTTTSAGNRTAGVAAATAAVASTTASVTLSGPPNL